MNEQRTRSWVARRGLGVGLIALFTVVACSGAATPTAAPSADPTRDKLAQVLARGTLVLWTDPDYAPQSFAVPEASRLATTKCAPNQMTAPEVSGYDAEVGKLVAAAWGVEPCFVTAPFDQVIAGGWGDHWDIAWASGALSADRMQQLYMTQPYYSTPANFFVRADSPYQKPSDLDGKKIGACSGCTHELYLKGTLALPGESLTPAVQDPQIVTYASETPGYEDLAAGTIDAFLSSQTVGLAAIADGKPLRMLEPAAFFTQKTGYVDRALTLDPVAFLDRIDSTISDLHAQGKLKALSMQFFGADLASAAAAFDLASVGQKVP